MTAYLYGDARRHIAKPRDCGESLCGRMVGPGQNQLADDRVLRSKFGAQFAALMAARASVLPVCKRCEASHAKAGAS